MPLLHIQQAGATWHFEPGQTALIALAVILYWLGCVRMMRSGVRIGPLRPLWFGVGIVMLVVALLSPLHTRAEQLLSAHMVQHTLLMLAPLPLLAARSGTRMMQALPKRSRGWLARLVLKASRTLTHVPALIIMIILIVAWHLPPLLEAATADPWLHAFQHMSLFAAAGIYWAVIIGHGARRNTRYGASLGSIFALMLVGGAVGGLMTFSTIQLYPGYAVRTGETGVSWLADQQLAGVVMWIPMGAILMALGSWLAYRWLGQDLFQEPVRSPVSGETRPGN